MPANSRSGSSFVQRCRPASLRRHPVHRPCHRRHFACSRLRTASSTRSASAARAARPRAVCSACSKRMAMCHQSSTIVAAGSASRCSRHNPASPSHNTVAGASACTPAAASACAKRLPRPPGRCGQTRSGAGYQRHRSPCPQSPRNGAPPGGADCARSRHQARPPRHRPPVPRSAAPSRSRADARLSRPPAAFCSGPCPRCAPRRSAAVRPTAPRPCRTAPAPHIGP